MQLGGVLEDFSFEKEEGKERALWSDDKLGHDKLGAWIWVAIMERKEAAARSLMKEQTDITSDKTKERGPDGYHGWFWVFLKFLGNLICLQKLEFLILNANFQHPVLPIPHPALTPISSPVSTLEALLPLLFYGHQACGHDVITCLLPLHMIVTWICWPSWIHWPTGLPGHSCQYCLFSAGVGNKIPLGLKMDVILSIQICSEWASFTCSWSGAI